MADEVATTALVYDARGAQEGAARFAASSEKIIAAAKRTGASGLAVAADIEKATTRVAGESLKQARSFDTLARRIDPLGQAVRDATRDLERLKTEAAGTGQSAVRAAELMGAAQARVTASLQAQSAVVAQINPALNAFGGEMSRAVAAAAALKAKIDPISAAYAENGARLRDLSTLSQLGLISDKQRVAILDQESTALRRKIAELDGSAQAAREAAVAEAQMAVQAKAFIAAADPAAASAARLAEQRAHADKLLAAGLITSAQHGAGLRALSQQTGDLTGKTSAASSMMRQFGIQSFDVFSQLQSGAPIMTTFVQQGSQIAQMAAAQGGALAALGAVAKSALGAILSPIGLAVAATVALGAGFAVVASKAGQMADEQRALSVSIQAVGRDADLSAKALQGYVSALARQGVSRDEANAITNTASRSGLSQAAIGQVTSLVPDAAVALGLDAKAAAEQLTAAARGSYDAIKKLDDALGFLSVKERDHIRRLTEQGDAAGAAGLAMARLGARVDGLREQSLTPIELAFERLGNGWSDFIGRVANSGPALAMMEKLRVAAENLGTMLANESPADLTIRLTEAQGRAMEARRMVESRKGSGFFGGVVDADRQQLKVAENELAAIQKRVDAIAQAASNAGANMQAVYGPTQTASDKSAKTLDEMSAALQRQNDVLKVAPHLREAVRAKQEAMIAATKAGMTATDAATYAQRAYDTAIATTTASIEAYQSKAAQSVVEEIAGLNRLRDARDATGVAAAELANEVDQATQSLRQSLDDPGSRAHVAQIKAEIEELKKLIPIRAQARAGSAVNQAIIGVEAETRTQERLTASYDGTSQSLTRARNANQAYAAVVKSMRPDQEGFNEAVTRYAAGLDQASASLLELEHRQQSVADLKSAFVNAFDTIGNAITQAFIQGQGAAVNWGNVMRGVVTQVIAQVAKLAILNPIMNGLFGTSAGTLSGALSAFGAVGGSAGQAGGGTSGGGGMLGNLSNLSSVAGLSDALGITSIKDTLLGWGNSLGLTGNGGLLGGLNSLLSTTLFQSGGSAASILAAGGGAYTPATISAIQASAAGSVSLGSLLGGIGGGFGLGSLAGGYLQGAMGKTGPGPTIGSGLGAVGGTLIGSLLGGPILGGLLGGVLGGGAGGLIGPQKASSFSSTGLGISASGGLDIGKTVSQIADTTAELAQLQQQVGQINQLLAASGAVITSLGGVSQIGQNTPGGFADPSKAAGIDDAFSGLRFSAPGNDTLNRAISGRSFGAAADLQGVIQEVMTFVDVTVPALKRLGEPAKFGLGTLGTALAELQAQFDVARSTAERLGYAVDDLAVANDNARKAVETAAYKQLSAANDDTRAKIAAGLASLSGSASEALAASLQAFDLAAAREREAARTSLLTAFGDAFEATQGYADQIALSERALSVDREIIIKAGNDRILAAEKQAADDRAAVAAQQVKSETDLGAAIRERFARLTGSNVTADLSQMQRQGQAEYIATRAALIPAGMQETPAIIVILQNLVASLNAERQAYLDNLALQWKDMRTGLLSREAAVANDNTPLQLRLFDTKAATEVEAFRKQIVALGASGSAVTDTLARLVAVQAAERKAIVDQAAAIEKGRQEARTAQARANQVGLEVRASQAAGNPAADQVRLFNLSATDEVTALRNSLKDLGFTATEVTAAVASLTAVQAKERTALINQAHQVRIDSSIDLQAREIAAKGNKIGDQLYLFDVRAAVEVSRTQEELVRLGFSTETVTRKMAKLVEIQGLERKALQDQAADIENTNRNAAAGTASGVIRSITDYARGLQFGAESSLSANAQLDAATRQFNAVRGAAAAGDFNSAQQLTGFAEVLRSAARNVFGSGVGYVDVIKKITDALEPISTMAPERLITSVMTTELRSQTQTLSADLMELKAAINQVRDSIRAGSGAPPAERRA